MDEEACDTGLALCIGGGGGGGGRGGGRGGYSVNRSRKRYHQEETPQPKPKTQVQLHALFPSHVKEEGREDEDQSSLSLLRPKTSSEEEEYSTDRDAHDYSGCCTKKKDGSSRKKLRLSKEQSTLLEESFRQHSTINQVQKHLLAERLNLRPRQVEVWFQNRRARTKLKQTEVDCEFLKKHCESLSNENWRLKKELQALRSVLKPPPPVYLFSKAAAKAATLAICPSCERMAAARDGRGRTRSGDSNTTFDAMATAGTRPNFYGCTAATAAAAAAVVVKDSSMACCK